MPDFHQRKQQVNRQNNAGGDIHEQHQGIGNRYIDNQYRDNVRAQFNQAGQQVGRDQYNAGRDVNVPLYVPPKPPTSLRFLQGTIGLVIFLAFAGGMLYFFLSSTGTITPTPDQTLSHFCDNLKFHKFTDAYNLYSSGLKQTVSFADFSRQWSSLEVESCYPSISGSSGGKAVATLTIAPVFSQTSKTHAVTLIQEDLLDWKIDSISEPGP